MSIPTSTISERLQNLGIELPPASPPAAAYVMSAAIGSTVFLSGHIAKQHGKPWVGKLGLDMDTATGKLAARAITIDLLATLQEHAGSLGLVNSTSEFTEHHLVINGCSELLFEVFGEAGKHARSAFGVAQIPLGCCVEIELIAELHP